MRRSMLLPAVVGALLAAAAAEEADMNRPVQAAKANRPARPGFFGRGDRLTLRIPRIGLETRLNFAPIVGGAIGSAALKGHPALIDPAAGPGLAEIGRPGAGLILGHRQWGLRPLVFAHLDKLHRGDPVVISGGDLALVFTVRGTSEIDPAKLWEVIDRFALAAAPGGSRAVILATCAPYGYNHKRLLIFAVEEGWNADALQGGGRDPSP